MKKTKKEHIMVCVSLIIALVSLVSCVSALQCSLPEIPETQSAPALQAELVRKSVPDILVAVCACRLYVKAPALRDHTWSVMMRATQECKNRCIPISSRCRTANPPGQRESKVYPLDWLEGAVMTIAEDVMTYDPLSETFRDHYHPLVVCDSLGSGCSVNESFVITPTDCKRTFPCTADMLSLDLVKCWREVDFSLRYRRFFRTKTINGEGYDVHETSHYSYLCEGLKVTEGVLGNRIIADRNAVYRPVKLNPVPALYIEARKECDDAIKEWLILDHKTRRSPSASPYGYAFKLPHWCPNRPVSVTSNYVIKMSNGSYLYTVPDFDYQLPPFKIIRDAPVDNALLPKGPGQWWVNLTPLLLPLTCTVGLTFNTRLQVYNDLEGYQYNDQPPWGDMIRTDEPQGHTVSVTTYRPQTTPRAHSLTTPLSLPLQNSTLQTDSTSASVWDTTVKQPHATTHAPAKPHQPSPLGKPYRVQSPPHFLYGILLGLGSAIAATAVFLFMW